MLDPVSSSMMTPSAGATRGATAAAPTTGAAAAEGSPHADFGQVLSQMALDAIGTVKSGEATAVAGVRGEATVQQVVEAVMAAEQTVQAGVAIRDKVVSAYLEISRMTI